MRKIAEIRADLASKITAVKGINPAESEALKKALGEMKELEAELDAAQKVELAERAIAKKKFEELEAREGRQFSMVKFLRELANDPTGKSLTGIEAEVAEMGADEFKRLGLSAKGAVVPSVALRASAGQNATTAADGGNLKTVMPLRYIDSLKERLVVAKLGATMVGDLVGDLPIAGSGNISAGWGAEGASASVTKIAFTRQSLTPHRNFVDCAFSKDLLRQTSLDVEAIVRQKMLDAHAVLIDTAAIAGTGANSQPTGILTGITNAASGLVATGTNGGPITWANIVALESVVNANNANRGKLGYLTNAKVIGDLKTIERTATNGRYLLDGDFTKLNGYPIEWTNLVPSNLTKGTASGVCSALIFGNFEDLWIAQWGGIDIVVDPFSLKKQADVEICLNAWNDCKVVEPKSFAAIKDLTTNL